MKYKTFIYTPVIIIITVLRCTGGSEHQSESRGIYNEKFNQASNLERIIAMWNRSSENSFHQSSTKTVFPEGNSVEEDLPKGSDFSENFPDEMSRCIEDHQFQITKDYTEGKNVIVSCFKTTLVLNILKYLGGSPNSEIKLFNGLLEFKKIPEKNCDSNEGGEGNDICNKKYGRNFENGFEKRRNDYLRIYKKALQKLMAERNRLNEYKNETRQEKENLLEKIHENSQAYLSEVVRNLGNEEAEKLEEEKIKREITDPKVLSLLDAFSKNYMLKLRFYPGVSARMMRSYNGGVTFDLELKEPSEETENDDDAGEEEEEEEEALSDEGSTREIKYDGPQAKDYMDDSDEESSGNRKKSKKGSKKKKKEAKKKIKKVKKILPYLLIPIMIQLTLLPFVFKKLFFLAMKALFAGKVALILVGFNLLRNTCIKNDDGYQKVRVEHYGYGKGEEYGAWINGRSLREPSTVMELSEEAYRGQKPVSS